MPDQATECPQRVLEKGNGGNGGLAPWWVPGRMQPAGASGGLPLVDLAHPTAFNASTVTAVSTLLAVDHL